MWRWVARMRKATDRARVPLVDAAHALGLTREQALRRVMRREIDGGKDDKGRWYIYADALDAARKN